jgi:hypothetical protein
MSARELLLISLRQAHLYLETRISACATEPEILYGRLPGSSLQSIGAIYAHAVLTEDHSFAQLRDDSPLSDGPSGLSSVWRGQSLSAIRGRRRSRRTSTCSAVTPKRSTRQQRRC